MFLAIVIFLQRYLIAETTIASSTQLNLKKMKVISSYNQAISKIFVSSIFVVPDNLQPIFN